MSTRIIFLPKAWAEWREYVRLAPGEVTVLGFVEQNGNDFCITDIHLIKQTADKANADMDDTAVAMFLTEQNKLGRDMGTLKLWMHDHDVMEPFWSGKDEENIRRLGGGTDWFLSVVTNKAGASLARLDVYKPIHLTLDKLPVSVKYTLPKEEADVCAARMKELVLPMNTISFDFGNHSLERYKGSNLPESHPFGFMGGVNDDTPRPTAEDLKGALDSIADMTQEEVNDELEEQDDELDALIVQFESGVISVAEYQQEHILLSNRIAELRVARLHAPHVELFQ